MTELVTDAKITWKSIVALATALAGALSAANVAGFDLPPSLSKAMVLVGVGALVIERLAETVDNFVKVKWGSEAPALRGDLARAATVVQAVPAVKLAEDRIAGVADTVVKDVEVEVDKAMKDLAGLLGIAGKGPVTVEPINPAPPAPTPQP